MILSWLALFCSINFSRAFCWKRIFLLFWYCSEIYILFFQQFTNLNSIKSIARVERTLQLNEKLNRTLCCCCKYNTWLLIFSKTNSFNIKFKKILGIHYLNTSVNPIFMLAFIGLLCAGFVAIEMIAFEFETNAFDFVRQIDRNIVSWLLQIILWFLFNRPFSMAQQNDLEYFCWWM